MDFLQQLAINGFMFSISFLPLCYWYEASLRCVIIYLVVLKNVLKIAERYTIQFFQHEHFLKTVLFSRYSMLKLQIKIQLSRYLLYFFELTDLFE